MSASAEVKWCAKVKERTEQEIADSLAYTLGNDINNVAEDEAQATFMVTIKVGSLTRKGDVPP